MIIQGKWSNYAWGKMKYFFSMIGNDFDFG